MPTSAGGLIGDILKGAGRATGVRPLEDLGRNADAEHKRFKDNNPVYKRVEENASELVRTPFSLACTANFEAIVGSVRAACSGFSSQSIASAEYTALEQAKNRLSSLGVVSNAELSGVSVRWCQGNFNGYGITPGPSEIILNRALLNESIDNIALTLAHEMHHIRQYRSMGAGPFKCNYSQQFLQCGGCQDQRHSMEREAFQFEASVATIMANRDQGTSSASRVNAFSTIRGTGTFLDQRIRETSEPTPARRLKTAVAKLARSTCTLEGMASKDVPVDTVASCIDDLEVLYADLGKWMTADYEKKELEPLKYYQEIAQNDVNAACQILAHTVKSEPDSKRT